MFRHEVEEEQRWTAKSMLAAGIAVTADEQNRIEVADFGLGELGHFGIQLLTYVNTERVCAKEIVLKPWQICPEHLHPPVMGEPGKEETFRCRAGTVYVYTPGEHSLNPHHQLRPEDHAILTVRMETVLGPGDQLTVLPETLHWFQAGPEGAIVSEFSTRSRDEFDVFTDPRIRRLPVIDD
jgi:D-lyxose ketol-isomerase